MKALSQHGKRTRSLTQQGRTTRFNSQHAPRVSRQEVVVVLPGVDKILGQADVGGGPCDGDLALR